METMLIQVTNQKAVALLRDLEELNLIKVIKESNRPLQKLSELFAGSLKLTDNQYESFQESLTSSRNEWSQDI